MDVRRVAGETQKIELIGMMDVDLEQKLISKWRNPLEIDLGSEWEGDNSIYQSRFTRCASCSAPRNHWASSRESGAQEVSCEVQKRIQELKTLS